MLADFLIIGAMKCGTSTLFHTLNQHPTVLMPTNKELRFFSDDVEFEQGYDVYHSNWPHSEGAVVRGEASPQYTMRPYRGLAASRIHAYRPDIKLIMIVRHPVERTISHWRHGHVRNSDRWGSFRECMTDEWPRERLINRSRYCYQLESYLEYFDAAQIKVVFLDELIDRPQDVVNELELFLGLPPAIQIAKTEKINAAPAGAPLVSEADLPLVLKLRDEIWEETRRFLAFCGRPEDYWSMDDVTRFVSAS